ncbi:MAG: ABC transporter ATP-binding protein [Candidatus Bathyarchaeia archaeon]
MLRVNNITVFRDNIRVLNDVSLYVKKGSCVGIIGPNGAGKSTLLYSIIGLVKVKKGSIIFMERDITNLPISERVKHGISICPERRRLFPEATVLDNLKMGAYTCKDRKSYRENLSKIFELFPVLEERKNQKAGSLSGGEQQMLAIGRALMSKPKLLLLDEPSLGLSPIMKYKIFEKIIELKDKENITIVLVEQDAYMVSSVADKIYVLEGGKILMEGDKEIIFRDDRIRKAYLGM